MNWQMSAALLASMVVLTSCGGNVKSTATPSLPTVVEKAAPEPVATAKGCGNDTTYKIDGKQYQVLSSAEGYTEKGTAAWYGAEYQGTPTAGCEVFDMYTYSAAHRTLPLPSFVRVTNEQNGKSIIVRVNDRGPFDSGDLIQLSFAAANALGIKNRSGAPVAVQALSANQMDEVQPQLRVPSVATNKANASAKTASEPLDNSKMYYVVAGTWPDQAAAFDMFVRLTSVGLGKTEMATAQEDGKMMHQVRIGPLYTQDQIDNVKDTLQSNGLANFRVVAR